MLQEGVVACDDLVQRQAPLLGEHANGGMHADDFRRGVMLEESVHEAERPQREFRLDGPPASLRADGGIKDEKRDPWVEAGKLKVEEDVIDGLENTPMALIGLLAGRNRGKRMVRL